MSEMNSSNDNSNILRVAGLLKIAAYALAAGGLFTWLILDKSLIGIAMLLVAAADGFASVFLVRRVVGRRQNNDRERTS